MLTRRGFLGLGAAGAGALLLGGCKDDVDITVGSKNFQEQWILSALLALLIERETDHSARSKDLGGTFLCHEALTNDKIQSYVEYTGTAYTAVLEKEPIHDVEQVLDTVRRIYEKKYGVLWLPPLGFENTYAILVRKSDAAEHGLETISDLRKVAGRFQPGFGFEFYDRADGYRGMVEAYDLDFGDSPKQMRLSHTYRALADGQVDVIAGNSTDGLIAHLDLVMLEDDQGYFPPYHAAPLLHAGAAEKYPEAAAALESLGGTIDTARMRQANFAVAHHKKSPKTVAEELLADLEV